MGYDPLMHHRRSIRLKGYDYRQAGWYFVTICVQDRLCLLGEVVDGNVRLNPAGKMVQSIWDELPSHYPGVDVDAFVVMPNHVHGIIILTPPDGCATVGAGPRAGPDAGPRAGPDAGPRAGPDAGPGTGQPRGVAPTLSLPDVVHRFKSLTTARYRHGVAECGWPCFPGRLWQRNYYEHIIRDEDDLQRIRTYIAANPARWNEDVYGPPNAVCTRPSPERRKR